MESEKYSWQGYLRQDGRCGIRNHILVIYTVKCSEFVARKIVENSDDPDVELIGFDGCTDNQYAVNLLISMIRHPNVGAVLAVGLGCEYIQPEWLADIARKEGKPSEWLFIQNEGGTLNAVKKGLDWVGKAKKMLLQVPRVPMGVQDLVIGAECGGSDYTSGLAGNVVVGRLYDRLVDLGGTAIFEEIVEAIGLDHLLIQRAVDERAREELRYTYDKALDYCKSVQQYSVSPGNFAGGLSTIEEKSMGALIKSGTRPIQGVLKISGSAKRRGLWLLDSTPDPYFMQFGITNPNDNEGLMDLISCGDYCKSVQQYSVSPGNFAGGLSTIEEKSMGALIKSGTRPIQGVLKISGSAKRRGLWLLDSTPDPYFMQFGITNPNDNEGLMDLISCGAHIVLLVTGRGNVVGSAVGPCIKITGNHSTFQRMRDDMDFDASPILSGEMSQEEMAEELLRTIIGVASGEKTKSEEMGHKEYFIPYKYQEKEVRC